MRVLRSYAPRYREEWLHKIEHAGVRRRAELLYQQLDGLQTLRRTLRPELLAESRKHKASKLLRQIPCIGPIRAARLLALMQTPHRFRSKRQLWTRACLIANWLPPLRKPRQRATKARGSDQSSSGGEGAQLAPGGQLPCLYGIAGRYPLNGY